VRLINYSEQRHRNDIDEKYHQLNLGNIGRVMYWQNFFGMIKNVNGDIVECGVGRGRSLLVIAAINSLLDKSEGGQRHIFGYDSFEGFPEPTPEDSSPRNPQKGEWSTSPSGTYTYSEDFTKLVLESADVPTERVTLAKGYFSESLAAHPDRAIALLHVDGDLYQSYQSTLQHLYARVAKGGVIVFDDFYEKDDDTPEPFPGARQAVKDFLGDDFCKLQVSMIGRYYFVKDTCL
jgi:O-methyltransferase